MKQWNPAQYITPSLNSHSQWVSSSNARTQLAFTNGQAKNWRRRVIERRGPGYIQGSDVATQPQPQPAGHRSLSWRHTQVNTSVWLRCQSNRQRTEQSNVVIKQAQLSLPSRATLRVTQYFATLLESHKVIGNGTIWLIVHELLMALYNNYGHIAKLVKVTSTSHNMLQWPMNICSQENMYRYNENRQ